MKLNRNLILINIAFIFILMPVKNVMSQFPFIMPHLIPKKIIVPLEDFKNTFVKVKVIEVGDRNSNPLFATWLAQIVFDPLDPFKLNNDESPFLSLPLVPYDSIKDSKFYLPNKNRIFQTQIKPNCNNYFPTSSGKRSYFYYIEDDRRKFDLPYHDKYDIKGEFEIPPNKSLYIEIDIVKREHKTSIIDTPADIFADMCK
ncbi:hypothetical protein [Leptospira kanakyensis]|uniref:hypothetical protein n=1 Tax=Leptospira kanakyensis TaxID=2484968 RepID=UPI00223E1043|nr:hypothetical protein [Leptospira kanakyensis]MCW7468820.1 hypothetical protein [Leptospira kanakyensis]